MRGWLLDTNVLSSLIAPDGAPSVKRWAAAIDERDAYLSILALAEYDKGIAKLPLLDPTRDVYASRRDHLETRFSGRIVPLGDAIVRRWGVITGRVARETGLTVPVIDTLFAATAIEESLYLVTRNVKDVRHSGAVVFNPWTDDIGDFPIVPDPRRLRDRR